MNDDLNICEPGPDPQDDYLKNTRRVVIALVIFASFQLVIILILVLVMVLKEPEYIAVEDGVPIGRVQLYAHSLRPNNVVIADLKDWVASCTSISSINIVEDMSLCLSHMEEEFAETRLSIYEEQGFIATIKASGCERSRTEFDEEKTSIFRDETGEYIQAEIQGEKKCFSDKGSVTRQKFSVIIEAKLEIKTKFRPLGFEVYKYEDI